MKRIMEVVKDGRRGERKRSVEAKLPEIPEDHNDSRSEN
jgi:hypothetical protein